MLVSLVAVGSSHEPAHVSGSDHRPVQTDTFEAGERQRVTMSEMLDLAEAALASTIANVDDYTARMIKHEQDRSGVLQPPSESLIKVSTRHRGGKPNSPMKVYLRFDSPDAVKGREVIWIENENDGKMLVREAGMIGGMMTVPLAPDSFLAMRGQRYPITEIGLTRLLEKLIERGGEDRDSEDVRVFKTEGYPFDGRELTLLEIIRSRPSGREGDFSRAELVLDRQRNVVVSFRSFGWPDANLADANLAVPSLVGPDLTADEAAELPLIESYQYLDLELNVGLSDEDFSTSNPEYTFKK
ncbi:hypothetical protein Pla100_32800 [Neorhodopirellula pilleata]|uniref:Uncharacterized protein n=2 Tax=Neorhodopirellula pilleata TaxID=2714738 RepID=A0A5C6A7Y8_9BACT|nr:hypothetical protein Pla100_32800 [Neorhodopirellula pilleata]